MVSCTANAPTDLRVTMSCPRTGRVEIVGKHTDYAGGRSLLMATSKSFCVVTVDRDDDVCRFFSTAYPEPVEVTMGADLQPREGGSVLLFQHAHRIDSVKCFCTTNCIVIVIGLVAIVYFWCWLWCY